jgi:hypothetical protein
MGGEGALGPPGPVGPAVPFGPCAPMLTLLKLVGHLPLVFSGASLWLALTHAL